MTNEAIKPELENNGQLTPEVPDKSPKTIEELSDQAGLQKEELQRELQAIIDNEAGLADVNAQGTEEAAPGAAPSGEAREVVSAASEIIDEIVELDPEEITGEQVEAWAGEWSKRLDEMRSEVSQTMTDNIRGYTRLREESNQRIMDAALGVFTGRKNELPKEGLAERDIAAISEEIEAGVDSKRGGEIADSLYESLSTTDDPQLLIDGADQLIALKKFYLASSFLLKAERSNRVSERHDKNAVIETYSEIAVKLAESGRSYRSTGVLKKAQSLGADENNPAFADAVGRISEIDPGATEEFEQGEEVSDDRLAA